VTELDVDGIRFTFDDSWSAVKWDDTDTYSLHIGRLQGSGHGTKAVDIIALCDGIPYLFEVKDFRGNAIAIANLQRDLPLEIGFKVRDTAAGLVGAVARGVTGPPAIWLEAVACNHNVVRVVAWIAEDAARPGEPEHKRKARLSQRAASIAQRLAWLTERRRILVEDPLREMSVRGVTAQSLPRAGPARSRS
jgi:hypothetical protein